MVFLDKLHMGLCILYLCLDSAMFQFIVLKQTVGDACHNLASVLLLRPSLGEVAEGQAQLSD